MSKTTKSEISGVSAAPVDSLASNPADPLPIEAAAAAAEPPAETAVEASDAAALQRACRQALAGCGVLERVNVEHAGQRYIAWFDADFAIVVENRGG